MGAYNVTYTERLNLMRRNSFHTRVIELSDGVSGVLASAIEVMSK